jgi:biopolymer transport protein ExbD
MAGAARADDDDGINEINVTPLVDVMLVLLVIFMVASVYIVKESIEIELPKAATATDTVETTVSIVMDKGRALYLNGDPISEANLAAACEAAAAKSPSTQAIIAADHSVSHGDVIRLIDLVRSHGLERFALNVKRPKADGAGESP